MKPFSFFVLSRVPFPLLSSPPSFPLCLSLHPLTSPGYYPANHPNLSSSLAAFRSAFAHTSSSSFSFYLSSPSPLHPSGPFPLSTLLYSYSISACAPSSTFLASHLRSPPPASPLLPPIYCSHPSLFRSPTTLPCLWISSLFLISPSFRISYFCFKENVGSM